MASEADDTSAMTTDSTTTGRDSDKFMLRFPEGMRTRISDAARASSRSMNAEVVSRLDGSLRAQGSSSLEIVAVIAKLQFELSHAHYRERTCLIEQRVLKEAVDELVKWIRDNDLAAKARGATRHFSQLEKMKDESQFAVCHFRDEAQKSELELLETKRRRDDALDALAKISPISIKE